MAAGRYGRWAGALGSVALSACLAGGAVTAQGEQIALGELYRDGVTFEKFLEASERRADAWHAHYDHGTADPAVVARARALQLGEVRLLVVAEDWCSDSVNTLPYLARLTEQVDSVDIRIIDSRVGAALMEQHPTADGRAATPTVVLLDGSNREIGAWIERPAPLQDWYQANQDTLTPRQLGRQKQDWYDQDQGEQTLLEIVALLERVAAGDPDIEFIARTSGTDQLLQAISPVPDTRTIWVSGHGGTWGRSMDGGTTWNTAVMMDAEQLQFRDVHGVDEETAYLLSAGSGDLSRIYKTGDGGTTWTLQFINRQPQGFFDCFDFWDPDHGVAFSDSVDGNFVILRTENGGDQWDHVAADNMPPALPGEGSFAASGTCVVTGDDGLAWIGTGAAETARVLFTRDWGTTWSAIAAPVPGGEAAGLTSLSFRDGQYGVAMGGDIADPDSHSTNVALTSDGGTTWQLGGGSSFSGAIYGGAWVPGSDALIAVGPKGIDYSVDGGHQWRPLHRAAHWAVGFASASTGWAVGPAGRITEIRLPTAPTAVAAPPQRPQPEPVTPITAEALLQRIDTDAAMLVLDVRTPEEFAAGHVPGAINIPHTEIETGLARVRRAGDIDVVVYCRSGRRAGIAETVLQANGLRRLLHLQGDMLGWIAKELPVETGPES